MIRDTARDVKVASLLITTTINSCQLPAFTFHVSLETTSCTLLVSLDFFKNYIFNLSRKVCIYLKKTGLYNVNSVLIGIDYNSVGYLLRISTFHYQISRNKLDLFSVCIGVYV